jgi:hypothetical protein
VINVHVNSVFGAAVLLVVVVVGTVGTAVLGATVEIVLAVDGMAVAAPPFRSKQ